LQTTAKSKKYKVENYTVFQNCPSPASNMPNSVCSSWISTKYRTLHYLNISYRYTYYDVRTLPCVLSVTSLLCQSLFSLSLHSICCYWQQDKAAAYPPKTKSLRQDQKWPLW